MVGVPLVGDLQFDGWLRRVHTERNLPIFWHTLVACLPRGKLGHDMGYVALPVNHNPDGLRSALLSGDSGLPRPLTIAMWCVVWDTVVPLVPTPIGPRRRPRIWH